MDRQVEWNKPAPVMIGKVRSIQSDGEYDYASKCGRFVIEKRMFNSSRGHFCTPGYKLRVIATGEATNWDTLRDAKDAAELENNPNWEP